MGSILGVGNRVLQLLQKLQSSIGSQMQLFKNWPLRKQTEISKKMYGMNAASFLSTCGVYSLYLNETNSCI